MRRRGLEGSLVFWKAKWRDIQNLDWGVDGLGWLRGGKKHKIVKETAPIKDEGKPYSEKLRRVAGDLSTEGILQKHLLKIHFPAKLTKIRKIQIFGPLRN